MWMNDDEWGLMGSSHNFSVFFLLASIIPSQGWYEHSPIWVYDEFNVLTVAHIFPEKRNVKFPNKAKSVTAW